MRLVHFTISYMILLQCIPGQFWSRLCILNIAHFSMAFEDRYCTFFPNDKSGQYILQKFILFVPRTKVDPKSTDCDNKELPICLKKWKTQRSLLHTTFSSDHFWESPRNCENALFLQKAHNIHNTQDTSKHKACNDYFCSKLYDTEKCLFVCHMCIKVSSELRQTPAESGVSQWAAALKAFSTFLK